VSDVFMGDRHVHRDVVVSVAELQQYPHDVANVGRSQTSGRYRWQSSLSICSYYSLLFVIRCYSLFVVIRYSLLFVVVVDGCCFVGSKTCEESRRCANRTNQLQNSTQHRLRLLFRSLSSSTLLSLPPSLSLSHSCQARRR
jgi:hypothetical protein